MASLPKEALCRFSHAREDIDLTPESLNHGRSPRHYSYDCLPAIVPVVNRSRSIFSVKMHLQS